MALPNPDERAQEVQWITGSGPAPQVQPLPAYAPNADAQMASLAREVVAAQQPVARPGGWVAPVARERVVANPYYTPAGGLAAYQQTGLMPPIMQSSPYATAAYGVGPDGSVSALVGFPSQYPHILNVGLRDYMAPLNNYMAAFNQQALDLLRARGGVGGGVSGGRIPGGTAPRTAATPAKEQPGPWSTEVFSPVSNAAAENSKFKPTDIEPMGIAYPEIDSIQQAANVDSIQQAQNVDSIQQAPSRNAVSLEDMLRLAAQTIPPIDKASLLYNILNSIPKNYEEIVNAPRPTAGEAAQLALQTIPPFNNASMLYNVIRNMLNNYGIANLFNRPAPSSVK